MVESVIGLHAEEFGAGGDRESLVVGGADALGVVSFENEPGGSFARLFGGGVVEAVVIIAARVGIPGGDAEILVLQGGKVGAANAEAIGVEGADGAAVGEIETVFGGGVGGKRGEDFSGGRDRRAVGVETGDIEA